MTVTKMIVRVLQTRQEELWRMQLRGGWKAKEKRSLKGMKIWFCKRKIYVLVVKQLYKPTVCWWWSCMEWKNQDTHWQSNGRESVSPFSLPQVLPEPRGGQQEKPPGVSCWGTAAWAAWAQHLPDLSLRSVLIKHPVRQITKNDSQ